MSIKKNTMWNLAGAGVPLLFAAICIPYVIGKIGAERFGVLTIIWVLIGYFSLFDFGLGRALTQRISTALADNMKILIPDIVFNGVMFTFATGLLGALLLACLSYPLAYRWLNISDALQADAFNSFLWAASGILLTTVSNGFRGVLEAYEDFKSVNVLKILLGISNFVSPAVSVMLFGDEVSSMVMILLIFRVILICCYYFQVEKKVNVSWFRRHLSISKIKDMMTFGAWMTVSNIISPIMVNFDRFFISNISGGAVVAFYTVPFEIISRILILPTALTTTLFPRLSANLKSDKDEARKIYFKSFNINLFVLGCICVVGALSAQWGLSVWVGQEFSEKSTVVCWILLVGVFFNGAAAFPYALIQAGGNAKITAKLHLFELIFYVPLLIFMINEFSIEGAAAAWSFRVFFDFCFLKYLAFKFFLLKDTSAVAQS